MDRKRRHLLAPSVFSVSAPNEFFLGARESPARQFSVGRHRHRWRACRTQLSSWPPAFCVLSIHASRPSPCRMVAAASAAWPDPYDSLVECVSAQGIRRSAMLDDRSIGTTSVCDLVTRQTTRWRLAFGNGTTRSWARSRRATLSDRQDCRRGGHAPADAPARCAAAVVARPEAAMRIGCSLLHVRFDEQEHGRTGSIMAGGSHKRLCALSSEKQRRTGENGVGSCITEAGVAPASGRRIGRGAYPTRKAQYRTPAALASGYASRPCRANRGDTSRERC
jgi:hypothetical protein